MPQDDCATLQAIEKNGVAHSLYWCHWPEMVRVEHPHAVVTESTLPCPFFNNVFSANFPHPIEEVAIDALVDRFRSRGVPCFWWSGPVKHDDRVVQVLESRGFVRAFEAAAMARSLADLIMPCRGEEDIVEVESVAELTEWSRTCSTAFEFDQSLSDWWRKLFTSIPCGGSAPLRHFLARLNGEPIATASMFVEDGVAGLASVGVCHEYRRQGIGSAIVWAALDVARSLGCELGVLFSSPMATSMYTKLGFRRHGTGLCYMWSPPGGQESAHH